MRLCLITVVVGLLMVSASYAQRDFSKTIIKTKPVAGSVYMLEGEGGNVALSIGPDGVLMIDDQFAELNERIVAAIEELTAEEIDFVLNTHWHGDHTGGNEQMTRRGAHIVAHENVRKRLSTKQVRKSTGRVDEAKPKEALPVLTYDDAVTFHFNNETMDVIHFGPGHTDGDSVVFFREANVVHTGDQMFSGRFPFIDLDSGGNVEGYLSNVGSVLEMIDGDTKIIPGHGPLSTKEDLQAFRDMIRYFTKTVRTAVEAGKTREDIEQMAIPEKYADWGSGFISNERWLNTLFTFYSKTK